MKRIMEHTEGNGHLLSAGVEYDVLYLLQVVEDVVPATSHDHSNATIPGLKTITGTITFADSTRQPGLSSEKFILQLSDGRKLTVFLEGGGRLKATGGFF